MKRTSLLLLLPLAACDDFSAIHVTDAGVRRLDGGFVSVTASVTCAGGPCLNGPPDCVHALFGLPYPSNGGFSDAGAAADCAALDGGLFALGTEAGQANFWCSLDLVDVCHPGVLGQGTADSFVLNST